MSADHVYRGNVPADRKATKQLETERLGLSDGTQPAVGYFLGIELHSSLLKVESLLNHRCQFANPTTFVACTTYIAYISSIYNIARGFCREGGQPNELESSV